MFAKRCRREQRRCLLHFAKVAEKIATKGFPLSTMAFRSTPAAVRPALTVVPLSQLNSWLSKPQSSRGGSPSDHTGGGVWAQLESYDTTHLHPTPTQPPAPSHPPRGIGLYDAAWQSGTEEWDGEVATMQREIDAYVAAEEFEEWEDACCAMPRAAWEDLEDWEENPEVMARAAWDESQEAQPQNPEPS